MKTLDGKRYRPRLFRSLGQWYAKNRVALPYRLNLTKTTRHVLSVRIEGVHPAISIHFHQHGFDVRVDREGTFWDMLLSVDIAVARSNKGYYCSLCLHDGEPHLFPTREALWEDHYFKELAQFLEQKLKPSHALCLHGKKDSFTMARLVTCNDPALQESESIILPVHVGS